MLVLIMLYEVALRYRTYEITLIIMFAIDWRLALWSLVLFPLLIVVVRVLQHFQRKAYQRLSNKQSNLNAYIHESIAGVKTTQTFANVSSSPRSRNSRGRCAARGCARCTCSSCCGRAWRSSR